MPTVLISGANRGLGLEFARQYARDGWRVHAASRAPATADRLADNVVGHFLDVTDPTQISALRARLADEQLDVIINNAGIWFPKVESLDGFDARAWESYMQVNALGPLIMAQAFADLLSPRGAKLVNVSSRSASIALADDTGFGYGASKAALNAITKSLSVDWRASNVIVIAITPGWVRTDMGG